MIRKIALKLGLAWLGSWIRGVAEGKQGTRLQAWYLALQGLKTWTGLILGAATAVMVYLTEPVLLDWVTGTLAALLLSAGLLDKAWRTPPVKVTESKAYRYAREHALDIGAAITVASSYLIACDDQIAGYLLRVGLTCAGGIRILGCVGAVLAWLGLEATSAEPPKAPPLKWVE